MSLQQLPIICNANIVLSSSTVPLMSVAFSACSICFAEDASKPIHSYTHAWMSIGASSSREDSNLNLGASSDSSSSPVPVSCSFLASSMRRSSPISKSCRFKEISQDYLRGGEPSIGLDNVCMSYACYHGHTRERGAPIHVCYYFILLKDVEYHIAITALSLFRELRFHSNDIKIVV